MWAIFNQCNLINYVKRHMKIYLDSKYDKHFILNFINNWYEEWNVCNWATCITRYLTVTFTAFMELNWHERMMCWKRMSYIPSIILLNCGLSIRKIIYWCRIWVNLRWQVFVHTCLLYPSSRIEWLIKHSFEIFISTAMNIYIFSLSMYK